MKRCLLLIVFVSFIPGINANNNDSIKVEKSDWAINLSYPSYFGILLADGFSKDYIYYPTGIGFSLDWKKESERTWHRTDPFRLFW